MWKYFGDSRAFERHRQPSYGLVRMSSTGEGASGEPSKNQALVDQDEGSSVSSDDDAQAGVRNIEIISQTWTKWSLLSAYAG